MSPIRKAKVRPKTAAPVQKAVAKKAAVAGDGGRKAQPALRVADDLRAVLDSIGDMVIITDPRLAVADANEAAVVALGYDSREEMAGMSAAALVADLERSQRKRQVESADGGKRSSWKQPPGRTPWGGWQLHQK